MNELELQEWRIGRLRAAIDRISKGNRTSFAKKLGYKDGAFVRQMLAGDRAVSEKTIRLIEALPGMSMWFGPGNESEVDKKQLSAESGVSVVKGLPDTGERADAPILDAQQIDEFIRELKEAFDAGDLTAARFALLQGLLREGRQNLANNFMREKLAVGGRSRGKDRKRHSG